MLVVALIGALMGPVFATTAPSESPPPEPLELGHDDIEYSESFRHQYKISTDEAHVAEVNSRLPDNDSFEVFGVRLTDDEFELLHGLEETSEVLSMALDGLGNSINGFSRSSHDFAGLWIDRNTQTVVVAVAGNLTRAAAVERAIADAARSWGPSTDGGLVEVRTVEHSRAELQAMEDKMWPNRSEAGQQSQSLSSHESVLRPPANAPVMPEPLTVRGTTIDDQNNSIVVETVDGRPVDLPTEVDVGAVRFEKAPEGFNQLHGQGAGQANYVPIRGGIISYFPFTGTYGTDPNRPNPHPDNPGACTMGFIGKSGSGGNRRFFVVTAAHCIGGHGSQPRVDIYQPTGEGDLFRSNAWWIRQFGGFVGDMAAIQVHPATMGYSVANWVLKTHAVHAWEITSQQATPVENQSLCGFLASSDDHRCAPVTDWDYDYTSGGIQYVDQGVWQQAAVIGDSGAGLRYGTKAKAILHTSAFGISLVGHISHLSTLEDVDGRDIKILKCLC